MLYTLYVLALKTSCISFLYGYVFLSTTKEEEKWREKKMRKINSYVNDYVKLFDAHFHNTSQCIHVCCPYIVQTDTRDMHLEI